MKLNTSVLVLLIATSLVVSQDGNTKKSRRGRGISVLKYRSQIRPGGCSRYGERCHKENEKDNCCLNEGGTCRFVNGRGVICAFHLKGSREGDPASNNFLWNKFWNEHWILYPGWEGGAFFIWNKRGKTPFAEGAGKDVDGVEVQSILPLIEGIQECTDTFVLGRETYTCKPEVGKLKEIVVGHGRRYKVMMWAVNTGICIVFRHRSYISDPKAIELAAYWKARLKEFGY